MVLHCELIWDDDIAIAGTAIAATDCVGHDGEVDDIDGVLPTLRDVQLYNHGVAGAVSDLADDIASVRLLPTNWPSSSAIVQYVDGGRPFSVATEAAVGHTLGGEGSPGGARFFQSRGRMNISVSKSTNWASGSSYLYASEANDDLYCILCYSYGAAYPYNGTNPIRWVKKTADAVEAAAEVWDNAFTAKLTSVSPGLDPSKQYILRAVGYISKDATKIAGAVRIGKETGAHKLIGSGAGTGGGTGALGGTFYWFDGIPCTGNDAFTVESHAIVVETTAPEILMGFEEIGTASAVGTGMSVGMGGGGGTIGAPSFGGGGFLGGLFGGR